MYLSTVIPIASVPPLRAVHLITYDNVFPVGRDRAVLGVTVGQILFLQRWYCTALSWPRNVRILLNVYVDRF